MPVCWVLEKTAATQQPTHPPTPLTHATRPPTQPNVQGEHAARVWGAIYGQEMFRGINDPDTPPEQRVFYRCAAAAAVAAAAVAAAAAKLLPLPLPLLQRLLLL